MKMQKLAPFLLLFLAACASARVGVQGAQTSTSCQEKGITLSLDKQSTDEGWAVKYFVSETNLPSLFRVCGIVSSDGAHDVYFGVQKKGGEYIDKEVIDFYLKKYMRGWKTVSYVVKKTKKINKKNLNMQVYYLYVTGKAGGQSKSYNLGFASIKTLKASERTYYITSSPLKRLPDGEKSSWKILDHFVKMLE